MKKIFRILNVRKHKSVIFAETYTSDGKKEQIVFDKNLYHKKALKKGDCFAATGKFIKNQSGENVLKIERILWVSPCQTWDEFKNLPNNSKGCERYAQSNARNAGKQIDVYRLKQELIQKISELLDKDGFENTPCKVLERERTGSAIPPFQTKGQFDKEPVYLRITPENQLKQTAAILLKSVYTIGSVFYNKNSDANHVPEMCTLEFVSLDYTKPQLLRFMTKVSRIMSTLCKKYGFETPEKGTPDIVDYNNLAELGIQYQRRIPEFKNTILINAPVSNPLVAPDENGLKTEIKWYINGRLTAHGYCDETDYSKVKEALQEQKNNNNLEYVNEMSYMKWGLPKSMSFGLGIDAFISRYVNSDSMLLASNPLGINYTFPDKTSQKQVSSQINITEQKKERNI
ncbi:MAG: hypothetical protein IJS26_00360 [Alphaproteobacteria bacterium]|nr:hypothetical protein [Alphaproteobacteria bacterium]